MTTCPADCGTDSPDGLLCHACTLRLERALGDVPAIVADLDVTISRQDRVPVVGGSPRGKQDVADDPGLAAQKHTRSPVHWGAVAVADDLRNTLTTWARDVSNETWRPEVDQLVVVRAKAQPFIGPFHDRCAHPSCERMRLVWIDPAPPLVQQVTLYLLGHIPEIRRHPAVAELVDEVLDAIGQARRIVDRPADRQFLGTCYVPDEADQPCMADIYASPGASHATCKLCGITHDVAERQQWLLREAEDRLFNIQEAAQVIGSYGSLRISESTIRTYVSTGQLGYHGKVDGRYVIRLGDLLGVIAHHAAKDKGRKLRPAV